MAERFFEPAMRVWVIGRLHDIDAAARIQNVMRSLGAKEAGTYLDGFMLTLGHGAKLQIQIHCACHPLVESDKGLLLDVLSLVQDCRALEALLILRGFVNDKSAPGILHCAQGLVAELAFAGQFLNAPDGKTPARLDSPCGFMTAAAGSSQTLH